MLKVTMVVPDDKMALVNELSKAIAEMEIVEVKEIDSIDQFQRKPPMERLDYAIHVVDNEKGVLINRYDYTWLYATIQQGQLKGIEKFHSVDSFRKHLINIGIENVPSNDMDVYVTSSLTGYSQTDAMLPKHNEG